MPTTKFNLGCGSQVVDGWTNVDYALGARLAKAPLFRLVNRSLGLFRMEWDERIVLHDLTKAFPWPDGSATVIYSSHTLEHMTRDQGIFFLRECHRILAGGGIIRVLVPDLRHVVDEYIGGRLPADRFVEELGVLYEQPATGWKKHLAPLLHFPHRCMYDVESLCGTMTAQGFVVRPRGAFDSDIADIRAIELEDRTRAAVIVEGVRR